MSRPTRWSTIYCKYKSIRIPEKNVSPTGTILQLLKTLSCKGQCCVTHGVQSWCQFSHPFYLCNNPATTCVKAEYRHCSPFRSIIPQAIQINSGVACLVVRMTPARCGSSIDSFLSLVFLPC